MTEVCVIRPGRKFQANKNRRVAKGDYSDGRASPRHAVAFEPSVHQKISRMAFDRGISFSSVVRELVDKGLQ